MTPSTGARAADMDAKIACDRIVGLPEYLAGRHLPAVRSMAKALGISRRGVVRALERLVSEGLLRYRRGCRYCPVNAAAPETPVRQCSDVRLARHLTELVTDGELRRGDTLPKIEALVRDHRVSKTTAIKAIRRMSAKGVVHREGRMYVVGPKPTGADRRHRADPPVVVLLQDRDLSWQSLASSGRTTRFCTWFDTEAEAHGVRLAAVYTNTLKVPPSALAIGIEQVSAYIGRLRNRYVGTLIVANVRRLDNLGSWTRALVRYRRPVVWFDEYDEPPADLPESRWFTRCHYSESAALRGGRRPRRSVAPDAFEVLADTLKEGA